MVAADQPEPVLRFATVDQRGRRLAYSSLGFGSPAVVLEAGLGCTISQWRTLPSALAADVRVVSYARSGLGQSGPGPTPRSCRTMVDDLHALLQVAQIPGPYILVGHSIGGLNVRFYADQYPDEVAGMVLLDPTPSGFQQRQLALLPPEQPGESAMLARIRNNLTRSYFASDTNREGVNLSVCCAEVAATAGFGDRPLILVTGDWRASWEPDFPTDLIDRLEEERQDSQRESLRISSNSVHIIAEGSGHFVHHDRPDVVLAAIQQVIRAVKTGTPLVQSRHSSGDSPQ